MANEFTRITHASSGSALYDINPNKNSGTSYINAPGHLSIGAYTSPYYTYIPVSGYKTFSGINPSDPGLVFMLKWLYNDDTESDTIGTLSTSWQDFTIPSNAKCAILLGTSGSSTWSSAWYSLRTS